MFFYLKRKEKIVKSEKIRVKCKKPEKIGVGGTKLASIILILCSLLVITSFTFFDRVNAEEPEPGTTSANPYMMDDAPEVANPFPDVVSDEEIDQVVASVTSKYKDESDLYMNRIVIELKNGEKIKLNSDLRGNTSSSLDYLQKYVNDIAKIYWYMVMPESTDKLDVTWFGRIMAISLNENQLDLSDNKINAADLKMTELEVNGEQVPTTRNYYEWNNGIHKRTYFKGTFEARDRLTFLGFYSQPVKKGSSGSGSGGSAALFLWYSTFRPSASFHYVDEMQYRELQKLNVADAVGERSGGGFWDATEPANKLDLTDLKEPLKLSGQADGRSLYFKSAKKYFNLPGETDVNTYFSEDGSEIIEGDVKPTYKEATQNSPLGYVYIADDIDKPDNPEDPDSFNPANDAGKGNYYFTPIVMPDGRMLFEKHYYILNRELPTPIKVNNVDAANNPVAGAKFDLYHLVPVLDEETGEPVSVDGQVQYKEVLLESGLTTDENGYLHQSSLSEVTYASLETLAGPESEYNPQQGYLVKNDLAYVTGGKYRLKQTEAPAEFNLASQDIDVTPVSKAVESKEDSVPVQNFTVVNELKKKATVKYKFVSEDDTELPEAVKALLPTDEKVYMEGETANPKAVSVSVVKVEGGSWRFAGYNPENIEITKDSPSELVFTGTWKFVKSEKPAEPTNNGKTTTPTKTSATPTKTAAAQTGAAPQTGDDMNLTLWIILCSLGVFAAAACLAFKKQK